MDALSNGVSIPSIIVDKSTADILIKYQDSVHVTFQAMSSDGMKILRYFHFTSGLISQWIPEYEQTQQFYKIYLVHRIWGSVLYGVLLLWSSIELGYCVTNFRHSKGSKPLLLVAIISLSKKCILIRPFAA